MQRNIRRQLNRMERKLVKAVLANSLDVIEQPSPKAAITDWEYDAWGNWYWWTDGQKVDDVDAAYQDIYDELYRLHELPAGDPQPLWLIQDECAEANRRSHDFNTFEFNTWLIELDAYHHNPTDPMTPTYFACRWHAECGAIRSLDKESRHDVWEIDPEWRYRDFLAYENDQAGIRHFNTENAFAYLC